MRVWLTDIVAHVAPLVTEVVGPADLEIDGVVPLDRAGPNKLTFCRSAEADISPLIGSLGGSAIFCPADFVAKWKQLQETALVISTNPRLAFLRAMQRFFEPARPAAGIHPAAVVDAGATIHPTASIGAGCYIGADVEIGEKTLIYPNVAIYCPARIGANVVINAGTVIGADGFGFERSDDGDLERFPHVGGVIIEDEAEVGANTCIDRGTLADTLICRGAKIDNLVHISHNVRVGRQAAVIANAMIGGSARIGDGAWIAPSAGILNQKHVGTGATVGFGALVVNDVPDGEVVMGAPAVSRERFREMQTAVKRLVDTEN